MDSISNRFASWSISTPLLHNSGARISRAMLACLALLVMLCAGPVANAFTAGITQPRITIASVGKLEFRNSGATLDVMLDVKNPTGIDLALNSLRFQCVFNNLARADGKSTGAVMVPSNSHALVPVRLSIGQDGLAGILSLVASGAKSVNYQLDGTAEIGPMMLDVPFSQQGHIALPH